MFGLVFFQVTKQIKINALEIRKMNSYKMPLALSLKPGGRLCKGGSIRAGQKVRACMGTGVRWECSRADAATSPSFLSLKHRECYVVLTENVAGQSRRLRGYKRGKQIQHTLAPKRQ